jgi:hypothetical protein
VTTNANPGVGVELALLEARELDVVSGGLPASSQIPTAELFWGPFRGYVQNSIWYTQRHGPDHLAMPAGL